jgi:CBS domain-containing protein
LQSHFKVRCGGCRSGFATVAELLEHKRDCDYDQVRPSLAPALRIPPGTALLQTKTGGTETTTPDGFVGHPTGPVERRLPATVPCGSRFTAGQVMTRPAVTVRQDATLWTAWGLLHGADYRHLVVVDYHRRPVGVLDEQTITRAWPHGPIAPHRQRVYDLAIPRLLPHVGPNDDMSAVARSMLRADADALPVVDEAGELLGLVTTRHLADLVAECV